MPQRFKGVTMSGLRFFPNLVILVNRLRWFQKSYSFPRITNRSRARIKIRICAIQGRAAFIMAIHEPIWVSYVRILISLWFEHISITIELTYRLVEIVLFSFFSILFFEWFEWLISGVRWPDDRTRSPNIWKRADRPPSQVKLSSHGGQRMADFRYTNYKILSL